MERTVSRIIDGDSFEVKTNIHDTYNVRLARVGAPEWNTKGGQTAKRVLTGLISGKIVRIKPLKKQGNRVIAEVFYAGRNINNVMIAKGYKNQGR